VTAKRDAANASPAAHASLCDNYDFHNFPFLFLILLELSV
jgi:hypothetical protein